MEIKRSLLREWLVLEDIRHEITDAAEKKDCHTLAQLVASYISAASHVTEDWANKPWEETLKAYEEAIVANLPTYPFPVLKSREKGEKMPWEYKGRSWFFWANLLANSYGWSLEQIAKLSIDDAIGLFQEIEISRQLGKEWEYGLSERAFVYDESSKKSHFHPLPRPDWMDQAKEMPKVKIPKRMMPVGLVYGADGKAVES